MTANRTGTPTPEIRHLSEIRHLHLATGSTAISPPAWQVRAAAAATPKPAADVAAASEAAPSAVPEKQPAGTRSKSHSSGTAKPAKTAKSAAAAQTAAAAKNAGAAKPDGAAKSTKPANSAGAAKSAKAKATKPPAAAKSTGKANGEAAASGTGTAKANGAAAKTTRTARATKATKATRTTRTTRATKAAKAAANGSAAKTAAKPRSRKGATARRPRLQYKVGQQLVYPLQGVGQVTTIEERPFRDDTLLYYVVYLEVSDMTIMVPVEKADELGIRAIVPRPEANGALRLIGEDYEPIPTDWKLRYQMNLDLLKAGSVRDIATVVRALYHRSRIKELPILERKLYDNARSLLVDELSFSLGKDKDTIQEMINTRLEAGVKP